MKKKQDIRDIFFDNIKSIFLKNKNFYICTNDADVFSLNKIKQKKRFINVGVAEQNLINISAGLASQKKIPLIFGFCTFLTFRCYEQIKFNISSHNLNCKIVGIGPGFSFPYDGPTHHGIQDLYLMYLIPEMEVINISDNNLADKISKNILKINGPVYIRLDKGVSNFNEKVSYNLKKGFEYTCLKKGNKKLILSTGTIIKTANEVSKHSKECDVINFFRYKNFDRALLKKIFKKYKKIIVFDENTYNGGISPIVNDMIININFRGKIKYLTLPDKQIFLYDTNRTKLLEKFKLDFYNLHKLVKGF
tara:strand:+ start:149 stop:1066 length:918 start_codon:yes stop_codon:yes gene_type:complete